MASVKFVKVTNTCNRAITIYTRFPRPKKPGGREPKPLESQITLGPGETTARTIALPALVGAKNWQTLNAQGCIALQYVPWTPAFATVTACKEPLAFHVRLSGKKLCRVGLTPGETSRTVPLLAVPQRRKLESLARRKRIEIERSWIGPTFAPGAAGSLGDDDVYTCDECGGPIVFRYFPPHPIHV